MVGGVHLHWNPRTRSYYDWIFKNVRSKTNIESLPDELLLEILVRVPEDDLYDKARLVCRRWYHMIRSDAFVNTHLKQCSTNYGLLVSYDDGRLIFVIVTKQGSIEISELDCKCRASSSCNGLVTGIRQCSRSNHRRDNNTPPFILNPTTKQAFDIAPFDSEGDHPNLCSIAYAGASMVYKVVQQCFPGHSAIQPILSVGLDNSWRRIMHLPSDAYARHPLYMPTPLITEGYIHWVWYWETEKLLTMNVETEIVTETNVPLPGADRHCYLSTGRYLTMLVSLDDILWNFWEMKPAESGEWKRQRYNIEFEAQHVQQFAKTLNCDCDDHELHYRHRLWPVGWVKYPEVLAFDVACADAFIFYNLRTHQILSHTGLHRSNEIYRAFPHRKTLVRLR